MHMTPDMLPALRASIDADPELKALPIGGDTSQFIADRLNLLQVPDFWVWRTAVTEQEYTDTSGVDVANNNAPTDWSWTTFIGLTVPNQNGWVRMFSSGTLNPSRPAVRRGISEIFTGNTTAAVAQRTHLIVRSQRRATRGERIYATGAGGFATLANLAAAGTLVFEGLIDRYDVEAARRLP